MSLLDWTTLIFFCNRSTFFCLADERCIADSMADAACPTACVLKILAVIRNGGGFHERGDSRGGYYDGAHDHDNCDGKKVGDKKRNKGGMSYNTRPRHSLVGNKQEQVGNSPKSIHHNTPCSLRSSLRGD